MRSRLAIIGGIILATTLALTSVSAHAGSQFRTVKDRDGDPVRTRNGNCVLTRLPELNECGLAVHHEIAIEDRTVYFDFNQSVLTPEARAKLDSLVPVLQADRSIKSVSIVGFADRIGSVSYNDKLSRKRALTVKDYLASKGYLSASVTKTRWVGKSQPTAACPAKLSRAQAIACLAPDRKVEVEVNYEKSVTTQMAPAPRHYYRHRR